MITYVKGNIFQSEAQTIVNPVNTVGVMGAGLAKQFKERYPSMFQTYKDVCSNNMFHVGQLMLSKQTDHWVLLFPTKDDWRNTSKMEYVEAGLKKFVETYKQKEITSVAFNKLGCGCGGLSWSDVKPLMEKYLSDIDIPVYVYI